MAWRARGGAERAGADEDRGAAEEKRLGSQNKGASKKMGIGRLGLKVVAVFKEIEDARVIGFHKVLIEQPQ